MPNWCNNNLKVIGDKKAVQQFIKENEQTTGEDKTALDFSKSVPMPEVSTADWYDFCTDNWGTKWNACEAQRGKVEKNDNGHDNWCVYYHFDTAWSPPVEWLEKTAEKYPHLKFGLDYKEEGMQFEGLAISETGKTTDTCRDMLQDLYNL